MEFGHGCRYVAGYPVLSFLKAEELNPFQPSNDGPPETNRMRRVGGRCERITVPRSHLTKNETTCTLFLKSEGTSQRGGGLPTILQILGWRLFFYANEGNEPMHVHCRKGNLECKYWMDPRRFDIEEAFSFNLSPSDTRQIRKIIYEHFEYIAQQWDEFQRRSRP